ncbi:lipid-A-disaccharide synthase [Microbacter margulisiae]|uniref:Lipid-A-disaccharide synthase n=1 Tax=Microbacter margulisiae TaxID=1350067 RepID=A0A7W5DMW1_9PORP|nr:lipid-A-disaccharide synthase [Microbacter margulisiae]MBB3185849.1 lipid-A-disaccharide synthase [Microbacter margulisiae]
MKYFIIAGEASGDLHGSNLMRALKNKDSNAKFRFLGGDLMKTEGGEPLIHLKKMAFMGFIPILLHLRTILKNISITKNAIWDFAPDVLILIDYPSFNLRIARFAKKQLGLSIYYYISPKLWAWKEYRIKEIKQYIDAILCIFPFEVDFYHNHQYQNVFYVGNPLIDAMPDPSSEHPSFDVFCQCNHLSNKPIIALLAGSREKEIQDNLPLMLSVISQFIDYQFVIAGAPGIDPLFYQQFFNDQTPVKLVFNQTYSLLQQSQAAIVTSGTATLETALLKVPQAVVYHLTPARLTPILKKWIIRTPYISLVNIIAQKQVVIELIGAEVTTQRLTKELTQMLYNNQYRTAILNEYKEIQAKLGQRGASQIAADKIIQLLTNKG